MICKFDIWNHLTYLKDGDIWYKQTFFENELLKYEDYQGNYWTPEFGEYSLPTIEFKLYGFFVINSDKYLTKIKYEGDKIIITLFGKVTQDTGYVYAPYVPMQLTPSVSDGTMAMSMALRSRYTKKVVNSQFYGTIHIQRPDEPIIALIQ